MLGDAAAPSAVEAIRATAAVARRALAGSDKRERIRG
jgi:hypothetical protein